MATSSSSSSTTTTAVSSHRAAYVMPSYSDRPLTPARASRRQTTTFQVAKTVQKSDGSVRLIPVQGQPSPRLFGAATVDAGGSSNFSDIHNVYQKSAGRRIGDSDDPKGKRTPSPRFSQDVPQDVHAASTRNSPAAAAAAATPATGTRATAGASAGSTLQIPTPHASTDSSTGMSNDMVVLNLSQADEASSSATGSARLNPTQSFTPYLAQYPAAAPATFLATFLATSLALPSGREISPTSTRSVPHYANPLDLEGFALDDTQRGHSGRSAAAAAASPSASPRIVVANSPTHTSGVTVGSLLAAARRAASPIAPLIGTGVSAMAIQRPRPYLLPPIRLPGNGSPTHLSAPPTSLSAPLPMRTLPTAGRVQAGSDPTHAPPGAIPDATSAPASLTSTTTAIPAAAAAADASIPLHATTAATTSLPTTESTSGRVPTGSATTQAPPSAIVGTTSAPANLTTSSTAAAASPMTTTPLPTTGSTTALPPIPSAGISVSLGASASATGAAAAPTQLVSSHQEDAPPSVRPVWNSPLPTPREAAARAVVAASASPSGVTVVVGYAGAPIATAGRPPRANHRCLFSKAVFNCCKCVCVGLYENLCRCISKCRR